MIYKTVGRFSHFSKTSFTGVELNILPIKITEAQNEAQNEAALSYHKVRGIYFLAGIFTTKTFMTMYVV